MHQHFVADGDRVRVYGGATPAEAKRNAVASIAWVPGELLRDAEPQPERSLELAGWAGFALGVLAGMLIVLALVRLA